MKVERMEEKLELCLVRLKAGRMGFCSAVQKVEPLELRWESRLVVQTAGS